MEGDDKACLDCPVCMEHYNTGQRTPKMMPCLHTVCASCLLDLTTSVSSPPSKLVSGETTEQPGTPTTSTDLAVSEDIEDNTVQVNTPPSLPLQHNVLNPMQRMVSCGHLNSDAISNLASILQGNKRAPNHRPASWNNQSTANDEEPPPLPARNLLMTAPPLRPKPMFGSTSQISPIAKEPEIPRNTIFQCPVCRAHVDSSKLQTNRYVIAHLRDLERLKRQSEPSSLIFRQLSPVVNQSQGTLMNFIPEQYWCNTCAKPCATECINHNHQPLDEYVQNVRGSLHNMLNDVEGRLVQHANSLDQTDASFKFVFQTLTKASRHLWKLNQSTKELKENVSTLRENISNYKGSNLTPQEALTLTTKAGCIRKLNDELAKLENSTISDDIFIWQQNNKLYVSTREPDQTIIISVTE